VINAKPPRGDDRAMIADGGNLFLQIVAGKEDHITRSWIFKYELLGRRHEMGLGPLHTVSLAEARAEARELRQRLLKGIDPLEARQKQRQALLAERARTFTFKQVAQDYLALHLDSFRNAKHQQQWQNTLATYVYPKIGAMAVADIEPPDVLRVIEPIWGTRRETAARVRQRVRKILDFATERKYRTGENPAASITSLPKGGNGKGHHAAIPFTELPAFMRELRGRTSRGARALEFAILTAARTGEVVGAGWDELDLDARTWTIPGSRMKAGREHKVPLCGRAVEILRGLDQHGKRVFPLSNKGLIDALKEMRAGFTVHGMRSAFKDWASERTNYPNIVSEMALAHAIGDKVEAAYRRGDLFAKRKRLMDEWGRYCASSPIALGSNVTPYRPRARA
jgi:integrase